MRFTPNMPNPDSYYVPSSFSGPVARLDVKAPPPRIGVDADRYDHRAGLR